MNKKIETYVNTLFADRGVTTSEIKEELIANLNDKYNDLINSGKSEEEAYAQAISGIGDIESLLRELGELPDYKPLEMDKNREKTGVFISIGVALYILSLVPVYLFGNSIGMVLMFIICAFATGFIVYGNSIGKINYTKTDNSFVEEYKEKISINSNRTKLRNAVTSSMWTLTVVIYLAFSFITMKWAWSWIIFLISACVQLIIIYKFAETENKPRVWHGILWIMAVILYFIISFGIEAWAWSWMIFPLAASAEQVIRMLILLKKADNER